MMYVVQTKTGCELSSGTLLERLGFNIKIPEKFMNIRRRGIWRLEKRLVFTGYIFLESEHPITPEEYYKVKSTDGVINFIGKGKPQKIYESEVQFIDWLWNSGEPIKPSKVFVTSNGEKMIMSGHLKKYNGEYADINIRQRRAKIMISICGINHKVTLPIEII
ncbi:transcription termination/antitermination NusG family protein [Porcipelethomonas sp.]|uniref:transcription termination/antitermination NusG family protein n=1 Tax=Porcipelethomonas sp. TaxID=2981675 RepID=UPI003EF5B50A